MLCHSTASSIYGGMREGTLGCSEEREEYLFHDVYCDSTVQHTLSTFRAQP